MLAVELPAPGALETVAGELRLTMGTWGPRGTGDRVRGAERRDPVSVWGPYQGWDPNFTQLKSRRALGYPVKSMWAGARIEEAVPGFAC